MAAKLLTLTTVKKYLRKEDSDASLDDVLNAYIEGVTTVVESRVGWAARRQETFTIRALGGRSYALPGFGPAEVTSGALLTGEEVDVTGMHVSDAGVLYAGAGSLPAAPWTVTLTVGYSEIPAHIQNAAAEILQEAIKTQRLAGSPDEAPKHFLIPYRAEAWLAPDATPLGFA